MGTERKIHNMIEENIKVDEENIFWHNELCRIWEKFDGKKITKHMETAFKKEYPDYCVSLTNDCSCYIRFWQDNYNNRRTHYLPYSFSGPAIFSLDKFKNNNDVCNGIAAEERNEKRKKFLLTNIKEIANKIDVVNTSIKELTTELCYPNPDYSSILGMIDKDKL